jgi:hypothetical protein
MQPIGLVPFQARSILPVAEEQCRTRDSQAAALRINLNVEGCVIVAAPVHDDEMNLPPGMFLASPQKRKKENLK